MASLSPADMSDNENAEFDRVFSEIAAGTPPSTEPEDTQPPEGNAPSEPAPPAFSEADEDDGQTDETGTSGSTPAPDQAPVEAPSDPWATASPELLAARDEIVRRAETAEHKARSDAERVKGLSRKLHSLTTAPAKQDVPPNEDQDARKLRLEQAREDYTDVIEPILGELDPIRREVGEATAYMRQLQAEREEATKHAELQVLAERHPDYVQVVTDPSWGQWLQYQPENIVRLSNSMDAREVSVVLGLFKAEHGTADPQVAPATGGPTAARRELQLDAGREVRSKPAPAPSGPPNDFEGAFKAGLAERETKALMARR